MGSSRNPYGENRRKKSLFVPVRRKKGLKPRPGPGYTDVVDLFERRAHPAGGFGGGAQVEQVESLGSYALRQSAEVFPLGRDSLLLGEFATLRPRWRVCDLGCGSGVLPLLLLDREPTLDVTAVDLDGAAAALCRANLAANGLAGTVLTGDLRDPALLPAGRFDLAVSNPPYFAAGSGGDGGAARMERSCTLDQLCAAAGRLVKNGGRFALVHRPERLCDLFSALRSHGLEPKRLRLCHHRADAPPFAVLAEAVRQGRPGLEVLPPALLHSTTGR